MPGEPQSLTQPGGDDDDVNAYIVLAFAIGGLVFDGTGLAVYYFIGGDGDDSEGEGQEGKGKTNDAPGSLAKRTNVNMLSALLHVFSDLLRSTTTLVESIVILMNPGLSSGNIDAISTLIVCSTIAVGVFTAFGPWWLNLQKYRNTDWDAMAIRVSDVEFTTTSPESEAKPKPESGKSILDEV